MHLNNTQLPQIQHTKYLGLHLDRRLTWNKHIITKRKQLQLKLNKLYWLLGKNCQLSLENKLLIYNIIIKPVWTYGIELWGSASKSNINIQRFQSKTLRMILNAPWYIINNMIHNDLNISTLNEEIKIFSRKYLQRLEKDPNITAMNILDNSTEIYRLKRFKPLDLQYKF